MEASVRDQTEVSHRDDGNQMVISGSNSPSNTCEEVLRPGDNIMRAQPYDSPLMVELLCATLQQTNVCPNSKGFDGLSPLHFQSFLVC
ncbi:hypothetical protein TNCV_558061 [Trichonephila clavipes]|nr:hypothetical protein TNCV_558061 [Trichonephila clavipes]